MTNIEEIEKVEGSAGGAGGVGLLRGVWAQGDGAGSRRGSRDGHRWGSFSGWGWPGPMAVVRWEFVCSSLPRMLTTIPQHPAGTLDTSVE